MKKKTNNIPLINYINKKKYLIFIKTHLNLFKNFDNNLNEQTLNRLILDKNNSVKSDIKIFNIFNFIKSNNKNKNSNSYNLLNKFKTYWYKINKKFLLNNYVDTDTIYLWLAYALNELLYINFKTKTFNYKLKENNLYIKLAGIIKINVDNILNNLKEKMTKSLLNKINNGKIYYIISNRIIKTCLKAKIFFKKNIKLYKKNINYIILNKNIYKKIFNVILHQSIQLPTLIPIIYTNKDDLVINKNENYTFNYNSTYIEALNYMNSQEIIINQDYFQYLCNLTRKELYKFSKGVINLKLLKKNFKNKIIILFFISNMFIINKYKNYTFYFQYKCDKRGRIYQTNWPMNSLYNKMLSPLFIFKNYNKEDAFIKPNFDDFYWFKAYTLNQFKALSLRDATNSIFQIAGCLLLDEKMLKYSNIHNDDIRYSIYDYLLDIYQNNINLLISNILKIYNINTIFISKIKNIERTFFKKCIMTWCYNESYKSSVKKIYEYIFIDTNTAKWFLKIDNLTNIEIKQIYWKIAQCIYKYIFDAFKINFKPYLKLKKLFTLIAKTLALNNSDIIIKHTKFNTHFFKQHHFQKDLKKIYIETLFKKKKCIYLFALDKSKLSLKDNKRSLSPNIIQYLDSVLAIYVILKCKEKNIPIITNHDCFYTTLENDFVILQIYNNALNELFIGHNFINDLILENNLLNNIHINKLYKELSNLRNINLEKIKNIFSKDIKFSISIKNNQYDDTLI